MVLVTKLNAAQPDLAALTASGQLLTETLKALVAAANPGVTTLELDELAEQHIRGHGGVPAFLGHRGFPGTICASVNEQVVHGIPNDVALAEGDVLSIDLGVKIQGWYTDSAVTVGIGRLTPEAERLLDVTRQAVEVAFAQTVAGRKTGDMGAAIQRYVEAAGFGVIRDCVGHGIGQKLHQEPSLPNYGKAGTGVTFTEGMVLAVEPMVTAGEPEITVADDKWTVATRDRGLAAHFEETIIVTDNTPLRLTPLESVFGRLPSEKSDAKLGRVA